MSLTIQKAGLWKRISAYMFDAILTVILAMGFALAISSLVKYDTCLADYNARREVYITQLEEKHDIDLEISQKDYDALTESERAQYDETKTIAKQELNVALNADKEFVALHSKLFALTLLILSLSILLSIVVIYLIAPLFFKNGQTLGKKIFGIAVMRTNFTKLTNPILFIRSIVGLFALETMFPILMLVMIAFGMLGSVGLITIVLMQVLQIGVMIGTKTNSSIHDLLSDTVVVDYASQRIFNTEEDMIAYKQEQYEKEVAESKENSNTF